MSNSIAPAAWLRCYRQNQETVARHRNALRRFATCLGRPPPVSYVDDRTLGPVPDRASNSSPAP